MNEVFETREIRLGDLAIPIIEVNGQMRVLLKPVAEDLGLGWAGVFMRVQRQLDYENYKVDRENVTRPMVTLSSADFFRWILMTRPSAKSAEAASAVVAVRQVLGEFGQSLLGRVT